MLQLIGIKNLNKSFAKLLHSYVQNEFKELIDILEKEKQKGYVNEICCI